MVVAVRESVRVVGVGCEVGAWKQNAGVSDTDVSDHVMLALISGIDKCWLSILLPEISLGSNR